MTVDVERHLAGRKKSPHVLVPAGLLEQELVVGRVLFVCEYSADVDDLVVAVVHAEDVHDSVPRTPEVASVHGRHLFRTAVAENLVFRKGKGQTVRSARRCRKALLALLPKFCLGSPSLNPAINCLGRGRPSTCEAMSTRQRRQAQYQKCAVIEEGRELEQHATTRRSLGYVQRDGRKLPKS